MKFAQSVKQERGIFGKEVVLVCSTMSTCNPESKMNCSKKLVPDLKNCKKFLSKTKVEKVGT